MTNKKLQERLAKLSPEQRELLLQQLKKKKQESQPAKKTPQFSVVPRDQSDYELSFAQQRLWFLDQLESGSASYNISAALRLTGELDIEALRQVFEKIVQRHESLRTAFVTVEGKGRQQIQESTPWQLPVEDISVLPEEAKNTEIEGAIRIEAQLPFVLSEPPLLRTRILKLDEESHILLLTMHHIVSDGWSMGVLIKEVGMLYQALAMGQPIELEALPIQYVDFAQWQRDWLQGDRLQEQLNYWREQLTDIPVLELPTDYSRPPVQTQNGAHLLVHFDRDMVAELNTISRQNGATLFMTLLTAFEVLLHRYSGQEEFCVGSPIANRTQSELEPLIGCFVNTLAIRADFTEDLSFSSLLKKVQKTMVAAYNHQDVPFERLVDELGVSREMSRSPLFQVLFSLTNTPREKGIELRGLHIEFIPSETNTSKFDLSLNLNEEDSELYGEWEFNTDLFSLPSIEKMHVHFTQLLRSVIANPEERISLLNMLSDEERHQVLYQWNQTQSDYERNESIVTLFEKQVVQCKNKIALTTQTTQVTYQELNGFANQIAHFLIGNDVVPGSRVAICAERSVESIAGILGILKAGCAFIPLDPAYPPERLNYMLEDTEASFVLLQPELRDSVVLNDVNIEPLELNHFTSFSKHNPAVHIEPMAAVYVMYTSGSTGKPKGIEVLHRNVVRLVRNTNFMTLNPDVVFLQYAPISFDAATLEIWGPLLNGGRLALAPAGQLTPEDIGLFIKEQQVNAAWFTAALFHYIAEYAPEVFSPLTQLLAGGDVLSPKLVKKVLADHPGLTLINGYGPTENTTFTCCFPMRNAAQVKGSVPIGYPIANTSVYILDSHLNPVPVGVPGELYAAGDGVANGYLNKPELTGDVFIKDPYSKEDNARLYKTGDLARWGENGAVEYLGRIDQQVKIRGYRIETGEIEQAILHLGGVREAVVIVREDSPGNKRLAAYLVPDSLGTLNTSDLRNRLKKVLPDYMVPSAFVVMDVLPVTANGKLDRKALPKPTFEKDQKGDRVEPRTDIEKSLAAIWQEVLNIEAVGVHDNFFELGGDSILSIQIIARAKREGLHFTPKQLFENQTIADLASAAGEQQKTILSEQGTLTGKVPLTPIQNWFFDLNLMQPQHWNQSVLLDVKDSSLTPLNLNAALEAIVDHHDALRMAFVKKEDEWHQSYLPKVPHAVLTESHCSLDALSDHCQALQTKLDLTAGKVFQAELFTLEDGSRKLFIVIHHLVVDGVSWRVLLDDFSLALKQLSHHKEIHLGDKGTSYRQWVKSLAAYQQSERAEKELHNWLDLAKKQTEESALLPVDGNKDDNVVADTRIIDVALDKHTTQQILTQANIAYRTEVNDLLMSALAQALGQWTNTKQFAINLEGHGRELIQEDIDLSRTIGWFTSIFPVLVPFIENDLEKQIKQSKETLRSVPNRGFDFLLQRYAHADLKMRHELAGLLKSQLTFNYLGQFDSVLSGNDLFGMSEEDKGLEHSATDRRTTLIDVVAYVADGQLKTQWIFSSKVFNQENIQRVAEFYLDSLKQIAEFCTSESRFGYTCSDFPLSNLSQAQIDEITAQSPDIESIYPLSPMQEGMLFHSLYEEGGDAYFEQLSVALREQLDEARFKKAWQLVVDRHQILRTAFIWEQVDKPLQIVFGKVNAQVEFLDWRNTSSSNVEEKINSFLAMDRENAFDLTSPKLNRITCINLPNGVSHFVWSFHHILIDGWSLPLVMGELFQLYSLLEKEQQPRLPSAPRYEDFIGWLARQDKQVANQFWSTYLEGFSAPTPLSITRPSYEQQTLEPAYDEQIITFSSELTSQLQKLSRDYHLTLSTLFQSAWGMLLCRYSGERDVLFGTTVSGRPGDLSNVENIIGLFINTLPFRVQIDENTLLLPLLKQLQQAQIEMRNLEATPLVDIHHHSEVPGDQQLFNSILVFENYPVSDELKGDSHLIDVDKLKTFEHTNYPLTLIVEPGQQLLLKVSYNKAVFEDEAIYRLLGHFGNILEGMLKFGDKPVLQWPILTQDEWRLMVYDWNQTKTDYPKQLGVHQLFEQWVEKTPDADAFIFEGQRLSYRELNERSNQLAHFLIEKGIATEEFVGIALDRSVEMIVSILAVLKAGGVYVPLAPDYPIDRLSYLLKDTNTPILLTSSAYQAYLSQLMGEALRAEMVVLEDQQANLISMPSTNPGLTMPKAGEQLCYVVYTSGSTGTPKGVLVPHRAVTRLVCNTNFVDFGQHSRMAHISNVSFDAATFEIWGAFANGGVLIGFSRDTVLDPDRLTQEMAKYNAKTMFLTVALFNALAHSNMEFFKGKTVLAGGEAVDPKQARRVLESGYIDRLQNGYGPSENCTFTTYYYIDDVPEGATNVPVGYPIANSTCYILDAFRHPVPIGAVGELYSGGDGVGLGYLNQPEKTADVFVPDPFADQEIAMMYNTGDLARFRSDGTIELLGRKDDQVKVRGFRIELGEVESSIAKLNSVRECVVLVQEEQPNQKRLVAFVVAEQDDQKLDSKELSNELASFIPSYMVPSIFVQLDAFPLSPNGKLDRRALKLPDLSERGHDQYVAPRNDVEEKLSGIWQQVLGNRVIGVFDNFFELGGDSIVCIQIVSRAKREGIDITAKQIFDLQTIARLAEVAGDSQTQLLTEQGLVKGECRLSAIQSWYAEQGQPHPEWFNQSLLLRVDDGGLTEANLKAAWLSVMEQHDAFRLTFSTPLTKDSIQSFNARMNLEDSWQSINLEGEHEDLALALDAVCNQVQSSFDLSSGPLARAVLIETSDQSERWLFIAIHHLVMDVFSYRILLEDFQQALAQLKLGQNAQLGSKGTSWSQWLSQIKQYGENTLLEEEGDYWSNLAQQIAKQESLTYPCDQQLDSASANTYANVQSIELKLSSETTQRLLTEAGKAHRTEINELLLTALAHTLTQWNGQSAHWIALEGHGREEISSQIDISRTIGWFTSLYPVLISAADSFADSIPANMKSLRSIPNKGLGFGVLKYLTNDESLAPLLSALPQPQISFNYLGQLDNTAEMGESFSLSEYKHGSENHPDNRRPHIVDVSGRVLGGQLLVNWQYPAKLIAEDKITELANAYLDNLTKLVDHCLQVERAYSVDDFPLAALDENALQTLVDRYQHIEAIFPLSATQEGMLFHSLYEPDSWVYFDQVSVDISGDINEEALYQAWQTVYDRHQILRTAFVSTGVKRSLQVVLDQFKVPFNKLDWSNLEEAEVTQRLEDFLIEDRNQGFQFDEPGQSRITWIKLPSGRFHMVWSFHHILLDGWSMPLVFSEVFDAYEIINKGQWVDWLPAPKYQNFIEFLEHQNIEEQQQFWKNYLAGFTATTPIPVKNSAAQVAELERLADSGEGVQAAARYCEQEILLKGSLLDGLQDVARKNRVTLNTLVQGIWGVLLSRYSGEEDVLFGTTVSGRPPELPGIEKMVGLFINTLPLRVKVDKQAAFGAWLQQLQEANKELKHYESSSLVEVQKVSDISSKEALFESILVFENYPVDEALQEKQTSFDLGEVETFQQTNFPLTLIVIPGHDNTLTLRFSYDSFQFSEASIGRMLGHLHTLLSAVKENDTQSVQELPLLTSEEERQILEEWNDTTSDYPLTLGLAQLFEDVVDQYGDHIATEFNGTQLTFVQLNETANRLAHWMRNNGVKVDDKVAICLDRSDAMIVSMLAILKMGAVYVPLHPEFPEERLSYILEDTAASLVVTNNQYRGALSFLKGTEKVRPVVWEQLQEEIQDCATHNLEPISNNDGARLAYVIYTSGSTGKPKGVCVTQKGVSRLILNTNYFTINASDRIAHSSNVSFDAATFEIWAGLLSGATLVIINKDTLLDPNVMNMALRERGINILFITTALFNLYSLENPKVFYGLNYLFFGGEACDPSRIRAVLEHGKPEHLLHMYGPTENATYTTWYEINEVLPGATNVPIGYPVANTQNYVLDEQLKPVPIGVPGEIYTSGEGLALGYLNRDDLTAAAFIDHPFIANQKMYKTGDLGRYLEDGAIEFVGRADDQVKIRGYRIELGEIELYVSQLPMLEKAFVMAQADPQGTKHVVAYVVLKEGQELSVAAMRGELKKHLPDYMIPAAFIALDELPIGQTGKVDRRALPVFDGQLDLGIEFVAPRTELEEQLAAIWCEVLKIPQVGVHDDFFELGGHSLLVTQAHSRIRERLQIELPLRSLFEVPTIEALAELISSISWNAADEVEQDGGDEDFDEGFL